MNDTVAPSGPDTKEETRLANSIVDDHLQGVNWAPDIVLYHGNCKDGFAAAWVCRHRFPSAELLPVHYSKKDEYNDGIIQKCAGKRVLMVDFSFKRADILKLSAIAASVVILDHHKTALADLQYFCTATRPMTIAGLEKWMRDTEAETSATGGGLNVFAWFDMNRSGAGMTWDFCHPTKQRPLLIDMVEDRDLWRHKMTGSKPLHAYLQSVGYDFDKWDDLGIEEECRRAVVIGKSLVRLIEKQIEMVAASAVTREFAYDLKVTACNAPYFMASDLGSYLLAKKPDIDFVVIYSASAEGVSISLRSTPDRVDVSMVAKQLGGGGHWDAAGCSAVSINYLLDKITLYARAIKATRGK